MMVIWIQVISMISVEYVTERGIHVDGSREHTARTTYLMVDINILWSVHHDTKTFKGSTNL